MPINTINFALASALLLMPPHYSVEQYQAYQTAFDDVTVLDYEQITQRILVSDGIIEMFYRLAYIDTRFFETFSDGELSKRFSITKKILEELSAFCNNSSELSENLEHFTDNFHKLYRLYKSYLE